MSLQQPSGLDIMHDILACRRLIRRSTGERMYEALPRLGNRLHHINNNNNNTNKNTNTVKHICVFTCGAHLIVRNGVEHEHFQII